VLASVTKPLLVEASLPLPVSCEGGGSELMRDRGHERMREWSVPQLVWTNIRTRDKFNDIGPKYQNSRVRSLVTPTHKFNDS